MLNKTWLGQKIFRYTGHIGELRALIPEFERVPFVFNGVENGYNDMIVSKTQPMGVALAPVAVVSKNYVLIQHDSVVTELAEAFRSIKMDINIFPGQLTLSEYGGRMYLRFIIPDFDFDPGDGYPLALEVACINSVDKSAALEISMNWYRLVCSNGMMFGLGTSKLRRLHMNSLSIEDLTKFIKEQLQDVGFDHNLYKNWLNIKVDVDALRLWVDDGLTKKWGSYLAARFYSIVRWGKDGDIRDNFFKGPTSERELKNLREVPGTDPPANNVFHVAQALSWLARDRNTIQDNLQKVIEIPILIEDMARSIGITEQLGQVFG